ncbi:hypothetical protein L7F22_055126 [Adiantum nelumboides]|nr:hypothetical protein [Adiantum nelumboides]
MPPLLQFLLWHSASPPLPKAPRKAHLPARVDQGATITGQIHVTPLQHQVPLFSIRMESQSLRPPTCMQPRAEDADGHATLVEAFLAILGAAVVRSTHTVAGDADNADVMLHQLVLILHQHGEHHPWRAHGCSSPVLSCGIIPRPPTLFASQKRVSPCRRCPRYKDMGSKGGQACTKQLGTEGYKEMGRKGELATIDMLGGEAAKAKGVDINESKFTSAKN